MVGVAIIGVAMALVAFKQHSANGQSVAAVNGNVGQEDLVDGEFED